MGLRILHNPRSCIQYTLYTDQTLWIRVEGSADYQSKFGFTVPGLRFIVSSGFKYLRSVFSRSEIKPCPGEDVRRRKLKPYSMSGRKLCTLLYQETAGLGNNYKLPVWFLPFPFQPLSWLINPFCVNLTLDILHIYIYTLLFTSSFYHKLHNSRIHCETLQTLILWVLTGYLYYVVYEDRMS